MKYLVSLVCVGLSSGASAQTLIHSFDSQTFNDQLGYSVANVGDIDGDGVNDLLAVARLAPTPGPGQGTAYVRSGATGELLFSFDSDSASLTFGISTNGVGDINQDGTPDILLGDSRHENPGGLEGRVVVYSGVDASVLFEVQADDESEGLGTRVVGLGDVNGDGLPDFAGLAPRATIGGFVGEGVLIVYSGADASELYSVVGIQDGLSTPASLANVGDLTGDGINEFAIGSSLNDDNGIYAGAVRIYDGSNGQSHFTFRGQAGDYFGTSVGEAGDVNGDGTPDIIVGASSFPQGPGYVQVFSGANGLPIHTLPSPVGFAATMYGMSVTGVGDIGGDGFDDFAVSFLGFGVVGYAMHDGATGNLIDLHHPSSLDNSVALGGNLVPMGDVNGDGVPDLAGSAASFAPNSSIRVAVVSTAPLELDADSPFVSIGDGGTQTLSIDFGPSHAGEFYWVFGSISGLSPQTPLLTQVIPLTFDNYFTFTIQNANTGFLVDTFGTLDGDGQASAAFSLPPGLDPSLVGRLGHHAAVSVALAPLRFTNVTNAYPLKLVD